MKRKIKDKNFDQLVEYYKKNCSVVNKKKVVLITVLACALLIGGGTTAGILISREIARNNEIKKENEGIIIDPSCESNTTISEAFITNEKGDKTGVVKSTTEDLIISISVSKGDKALKEGEEYIATPIESNDAALSWRVIILKSAIDKHEGKIRIVAKYGEKAKEFTITLDDQFSGDPTVNKIIVREGEYLPYQGSKHHDDYGLVGWYLDKECTEEFDFNTPITSNINLYGKWKEASTDGLMFVPDNPDEPTAYTVCRSTDEEEYKKLPKNVVIPSTYNQLPVTGINSWEDEDTRAFCYTEIETVSIPSTIDIIPPSAFYGCHKLKEVSLPDSIKNIENYAFYCCYSLVAINLNEGIEIIDFYAFHECYSLKNLTFPSTIKYINTSSFEDCHTLKSVDFSKCNQITEIGYRAFYDDHSIESIKLPMDGVLEKIGYCAFEDVYALKRVDIPASVKSIGTQAFDCCYNLKTLNFANENNLQVIEASAFCDCILDSFVVPKNVYYIGSYALDSVLRNVTFKNNTDTWYVYDHKDNYNPNDPTETNARDLLNDGKPFTRNGHKDDKGELYFTTIGDDECVVNGVANTSITKATIPLEVTLNNAKYKVTGVSAGAFKSNNTITEVEFEVDNNNENLNFKTIEASAFAYCENLVTFTNIDKCKNLSKIGGYAFQYTGNNKQGNVNLDLSNSKVKIIDDYGFYTFTGLKKIYLPETLEVIGDNAFEDCYYMEVCDFTKCKNLAVLGTEDGYCFDECEALEEIDFSNTKLKTICEDCFYECESLEKVDLPDTLLYIQESAFDDCYYLKEIRLPKYLMYMDNYAFDETYYLEKVIIDSIYIDYLYHLGKGYNIFYNYYAVSFYVPEGRELGEEILEDYEKEETSDVPNYDKYTLID